MKKQTKIHMTDFFFELKIYFNSKIEKKKGLLLLFFVWGWHSDKTRTRFVILHRWNSWESAMIINDSILLRMRLEMTLIRFFFGIHNNFTLQNIKLSFPFSWFFENLQGSIKNHFFCDCQQNWHQESRNWNHCESHDNHSKSDSQ